jgi:DNA topoisomerase-2
VETSAMTWVPENGKFEQKILSWVPGFQKMFDEIITNSVDFSKTPAGKHVDTIKVEVNRETGEMSVFDNGGIPVVKHAEYDEYVPTMIFGYLRSGSNFDDDDEDDNTGSGQNGEGSSLTNIFSTKFVVETCDGKNKFKQTWTNNMQTVSEPTVLPANGAKGYTKITWMPDYAHLKMQLDDGNYTKIIKRVTDVAGCNPKLKVHLNGERIKIDSFKDYIAMYDPVYEYDEMTDWQVGVTHSDEGYQQVSFVNTTETLQGGTHTAHVAYEIAEKIRAFFKTKHKVDVKPTDILNHMRIFVNVTMDRPRYDSQTKEKLMTDKKQWRSVYVANNKFIDRVLKSEIIQRVLDWVEAKKKALEMAKLREANKDLKSTSVKKITKLQDANWAGKKPEECILFLTEGDSAAKAGQNTCDRDRMGFLALRGKPLNVNSVDLVKVFGKKEKKNGEEERNAQGQEFMNFMAAMGLKIGVQVTSIKQLRYAKIGIMTDADHDGAGHITGLLISNIHKFWPELFSLGVMHRFITPLVKVWVKGSKKPLSFYEEHEFATWQEKNASAQFKMKYYKGLATSQNDEFREYLENINDHIIRIDIEDQDDRDDIELVFGKGEGAANKRKTWLALEA